MGRRDETIAGKYKLLGQIARGGMGEIHEAQHLTTDRQLAIKLLRPELAQREEHRARFEREARAATRIDHDNVCEVLDFGVTEEGVHFLVMPLLRGQTLKEALGEKGEMPFERSCDIAGQILDALVAAHKNGVIHRDLKPENIFLITLGGRKDFVKVLDFGITKFVSRPGEDKSSLTSTLTRTGLLLGTPHYTSPEQARGDTDIDERADLYAVGAILYEMFTGRRPVEGETVNELLWNLWNVPLKSPSALRPEIPAEAETMVLKAMSRAPDRRFQSATAMREALFRAFEDSHSQPIDSSTPTSIEEPALTDQGDAIGRESTDRGEAETSLEVDEGKEAEDHPPVEEARPHPLRRSPTVVVAFVLLLGLSLAGLLISVAREGDIHSEEVAQEGLSNPIDESPSSSSLEVSTSLPMSSSGDDEQVEKSLKSLGADSSVDSGVVDPEDGGQEMVRITLSDLPVGAVVTLGGERYEGPELMVARSTREVMLEIRAKGYRPWRRHISLDVDLSPLIRLKRIPAAQKTVPVKSGHEDLDAPWKAERGIRPLESPHEVNRSSQSSSDEPLVPIRSFGEAP